MFHFYKKEEKYSIRYKYVKSDIPFSMQFLNVKTNEIERVSIPDYYTLPRKTKSIRIPKAYGVPTSMKDLIDLLHSHGFVSYNVDGTEL